MKRTNKAIALLLSVLLVLTLFAPLSVVSFAAGEADIYVSGTCGAQGDNLTWTLSTDGVLTISGRGEMKNYRHMQPDMSPWYKSLGAHTDYPDVVKAVVEENVTSIGDYAFHGLRQLSEVSLPSTVTHLGEHCFSFCESLETLELPAGLTKIEIRAFCQAEGLTHITIPEGVTVIEQQAFEACNSLTSITLPDSLTTIGEYAFNGTALTTFHVSAGLETIDYRALPTGKITAYSADENNPNYAADEAGCLYTKDMQTLLYYPVANTRTEFTVPSGVKTIAAYACAYSNYLETVNLPDGLETIEASAFNCCYKMKSAYIPDSVTYLGGGAYCNTSLESVHLSSALTTIPGGVFYGCSFTEFEVPEGITTIGNAAFRACQQLKTVTLPVSLDKIEQDAFVYTALEEIYYGGSEAQWYAIDITVNGNKLVFDAQKHFTNNFLPEGHDWDDGTVQQALTCEQPGITVFACADCDETYTETVPAIGHRYDEGRRTKAPTCEETGETTYTCAVCGNTYTEDIPATGHRWEYNIHPSYDESVPGTVGAICKNNSLHNRSFEIPGYGMTVAFGECGTEGSDVHYVLYQNGTIYVFGSGEVKDQAFYRIGVSYNRTFTKLIIDEGITAIGKHAFSGNPLGDITLPDSLKTIGVGAFADIVISNIHFGSGLETIESGAFSTCFSGSDSQKKLVLPDSVKTVENNAFAYCDGLEEITFGPNVETVGDSVLYCGFHLQKATFLNGNTEIDLGAASETPADFTVYSHSGGKVEAFANARGYNFVAIDAAGHDWGDWTIVQNSTYDEPGLAQRVCQIDPSHTETFEIPAYGPAVKVGYCGKDGDPVYFAIYEDNTMHVFGEGVVCGNVFLLVTPYQPSDLVIDEGITELAMNAFRYMGYDEGYLTSVTFPDSLTKIGQCAFWDCTNITEIRFGSGLTYVDRDAFPYLTHLETVALPKSVTHLGNQAFYGCVRLKTAVIPAGVTEIGSKTFCECRRLENLVILNGNATMADNCLVEIDGATPTIYSYEGGSVEAFANANGFRFVPLDDAYWVRLPYTTDGLADGDWYFDADKFVDIIGDGKTAAEKQEVLNNLRAHTAFYYYPDGELFLLRYDYNELPIDGVPATGSTMYPYEFIVNPQTASTTDYNAMLSSIFQYKKPADPEKPTEPEEKPEEKGNWFQEHIIGPLRAAVSTILSFFRRMFKSKK